VLLEECGNIDISTPVVGSRSFGLGVLGVGGALLGFEGSGLVSALAGLLGLWGVGGVGGGSGFSLCGRCPLLFRRCCCFGGGVGGWWLFFENCIVDAEHL
jgi:hypothetical protein